jgi:hypothetical protein
MALGVAPLRLSTRSENASIDSIASFKAAMKDDSFVRDEKLGSVSFVMITLDPYEREQILNVLGEPLDLFFQPDDGLVGVVLLLEVYLQKDHAGFDRVNLSAEVCRLLYLVEDVL